VNAPGAIVFFGDSLTVGLGLDPSLAFPARIEEKLAGSGLGHAYRVVSAGVSGETTSAGLRRFEWISRQPIDVLVLALGANDGLRGIDVEHTRENLQAIIDLAREKHPEIEIVLAGMLAPPNMGERFTTDFREIFPRLAEENELALIPFLLEGVAGDPALNLPDGIHPDAAGHRIVADNVWAVLRPLLDDEP